MTSLVQSNQRNARFIQCFAAYPAKVCQEARDLTLYSEPLLQYKQRKVRRRLGRRNDSGNDLSEEGGHDQEEEEEEDSSDDDSDGEIIHSSDLNELLEMGDYQREPRFDVENDAGKWRIKRNALEKQYLSFDGFPKDFFVYCVMSTEDSGVMVRRYTLATSQKHISVKDITKLKQKWQAKTANTSNGLARDEQVDGGKSGSNGKGKFNQLTDGEDYDITAASLSPLISVAHVHTEDILTLSATTEVMLYNNVKLARIYRCMKHCNSLTITELANQPETALLHSDHLFQAAFCMLSNLLATPAISPVGLSNVDTVVRPLPLLCIVYL